MPKSSLLPVVEDEKNCLGENVSKQNQKKKDTAY